MVAEERTGTHSPYALARQLEVLVPLIWPVKWAFLFASLSERLGSGLAWGICIRIKASWLALTYPAFTQKTACTSEDECKWSSGSTMGVPSPTFTSGRSV